MASFDPVSALLGGALIGLASALLMILSGRIAGISGILGGVLARGSGDTGWRIAFIVGLVGAPLLLALIGRPMAAADMPTSWILIAVAGVLVGVGTKLGSGCTSGHGVCGLARLSVRSLVATCVFMGAAALTVAIVRHAVGG